MCNFVYSNYSLAKNGCELVSFGSSVVSTSCEQVSVGSVLQFIRKIVSDFFKLNRLIVD